MYGFLNFLWEILKFLFIVLVGFTVFIGFVLLCSKFDEKRDKQECYEIYATDNVILKKCEKYFEKREDWYLWTLKNLLG